MYGNCYIFNSKQNTKDSLAGKRSLALTGPTFGLSLVLNLNQKYYLKQGATPKVHKYSLDRNKFFSWLYYICIYIYKTSSCKLLFVYN